jgi:hypothetical protein
MDAVVQGRGEQFMPALREGSEQQHGILDIRHRIGARILRRKHATSFFSRQDCVRNGQQQGPRPFRTNGGYLSLSFAGHARDGKPTHPAS